MLKLPKRTVAATGAAALMLSLAACGSSNNGGDDAGSVSGSVAVDGSSTVYPMSNTAAEYLSEENPEVEVSVGFSGTGGGFEKFCAGETDISDASRPIKDEEAATCKEAGVDYTELLVATDALTVVVHPDLAVDCVTVDQLKQLFGPDKPAKNWKELDPSFPDQAITGYVPGTDSGTYDYMNSDVVESEKEILREDFESSEDDNVLVQGVSGTKGAVGFFGFTYYEENTDKLKALEIDGGNGCVAPSVDTARDGSYSPLARPLFIYVANESYDAEDGATKEYVDFYIENLAEIAETAQFIPLSDDDYGNTQKALEGIA
ncbi:PstS family phosphate ABC transporter substrate-binding protein [Nocardioides sp. NPDC057772]|uniref:PstS family phosphate ABC transporter substrate-binding protein n=1 Tax=Nocardioides sp. NPDC057772 TaxID=3346245 RepID=UPI0036720A94